jgi:hypothetical protein
MAALSRVGYVNIRRPFGIAFYSSTFTLGRGKANGLPPKVHLLTILLGRLP